MVKIQSIVSEEKIFKEKVYGRTHGRTDEGTGRTDGRTDARRHHAMTIARLPSASGAKKELIERLKKGKQPSDYNKNVLLEQAQYEGILVNATMSKETILKKLTNP